jgi:hypothetical protein
MNYAWLSGAKNVPLKVLSANSKRGRYYAQIIRAGELEAHLFFFLNVKGTPSQKEQKSIFSGLTICKMDNTYKDERRNCWDQSPNS